MAECPFGADHPEFRLTKYPDGVADLTVCWDSTNVREIARMLREMAAALDQLPEDATAIGVPELRRDPV